MAKKRASDKVLFTVVVLLVAGGLVMVYSASAVVARSEGEGGGLLGNPFLVKQGAAAALGLVAMLCAMHFDYRHLKLPLVAWGLLLATVALLVAVLFAPELNGTRRWFVFGPLSLQPAELAKLALIPFVAYHLDRKPGRVNGPELLLPVAAATGLVCGLVLLQPDLGTSALLMGTVVLMVFVAGLSWRRLALAAAVLAPVAVVALLAAPYRRQRLLAFLDPEADPLGAGYQVLQSLIAVGSGGVFGLGLGNSAQKLFFLPYPHSDFIYAIVAEELGMVGALAVVALFLVLLWRGLAAAWNAPDAFGRHLGLGLTGILVLQALINVSVAVALLPTKGIPLPFLSYGGSSLVVSMTACGMLLNLSEHG
jgi:cell division protein FtsW